MFWHLVKNIKFLLAKTKKQSVWNIQWFHFYKCWNADMNSGLWLGSRAGTPPPDMKVSSECRKLMWYVWLMYIWICGFQKRCRNVKKLSPTSFKLLFSTKTQRFLVKKCSKSTHLRSLKLTIFYIFAWKDTKMIK